MGNLLALFDWGILFFCRVLFSRRGYVFAYTGGLHEETA
jgi:hypothetical protein